MKLPEREILYTIGMSIDGYGPFHIRGYTEAQMRQAIRDAFEEAASFVQHVVSQRIAVEVLDLPDAIRKLKETV